jgi:nucleoside-diphosphate-sugar epimerase
VKRLLITGATGFIGTHCLQLCLQENYDEIHAVNRKGTGARNGQITWHAADLRDPQEAFRIVKTVHPTHIFHAAWIATPGVYSHSPENEDWVRASLALVEAFATQGGKRFVGVGSSAEYAASDEPCEEDRTPLNPASFYGRSKINAWVGVQAIAERNGMTAAWGRLFLPFGPGDSPSRLIPSVLASIRKGQPIPLSHGEQLRDFVYAPDAANQLVRLLASDANGAFNIGTGISRSIRSALEDIADRLNGRRYFRFGELPLREGEPMVLVANMTKFESRIGVVAATSWSDAIGETIKEWGNRKRR